LKLLDLLPLERITVPLEVTTLSDATFVLLDSVFGPRGSTETVDEVSDDSITRDAVTVGQQSFVLHLRTDQVGAVAVALGVAREPIQQDDHAGKQGRIVVLIVGPHSDPSAFLQAVSAFAAVLGKESVVEGLLAAKSADEIGSIPDLAAVTLRGYLTVRDLMTRRVLSVRTDTTLGEATRIMVTQRVSDLPVVSETNEVIGVITHKEILGVMLPRYLKRMKSGQFIAARLRLPGEVSDPRMIPVGEVMNRSVLCTSEDQAMADVATMMINKDIARFPVTRDGILVGTLTKEEVVRRMFGP
jgi:CBS domain-containing protein